MPLINCKIELKLKWTKYCILAAAGAVNLNVDSDNIIFTINDTKLYVPVAILSARDNQNYQNFLLKELKGQVIGMNINQKVIIKLRQMNIDISSNQVLLELIDCLF